MVKKKKGFSRKRVYELEFRDGDPITDGLEVKATAPTVAESYELGKPRKGESNPAYVRRQMEELVGHVVEWNLIDDDDEPLPLTIDALETVDVYVVTRITDAWLDIGKVLDEASPLDSHSGTGSPGGSTVVRDPRMEASIHAQALP